MMGTNFRQPAIRAFCRLRRLQEASSLGYVRCVTCGKAMKWNECDGGHMVSRNIRGTELEPDNVWPQCIACNRFGNITENEYAAILSEKIGKKRVEAVLAKKDNHDKKPYAGLQKRYEAECRMIRKEKGL